MTVRTWTIVVNAPDVWLTANDRYSKEKLARLVAVWRNAAYLAAKQARPPRGLQKVRIQPVARFRGQPPVRESPNLAPTVKACVDGLGPQRRTRKRNGSPSLAPGYGLVPDDSDRHVVLAPTIIGERLPAKPYASVGELVLRIEEIADV